MLPNNRLMGLLGILLAVTCGTGCTSAESNCTSDADCDGDQRCVAGGGVFVGGGRCVPEGALADVGPVVDATDTAEPEVSDTDMPDTERPDTKRPDSTPDRDGGSPDADADGDGGRVERDTTPAGCSSPPDRCPCDFRGRSTGVCGDASTDPETGECRAPAEFSATDEEAAGNLCDGIDNDCDGAVDEGCACAYDGRGAGVCSGQRRDSFGNCPEPDAYERAEQSCADGRDNDCDGEADCGDSDCTGEACGRDGGAGAVCRDENCHEVACTDGKDNDGDGEVDESTVGVGDACQRDCECHSGVCNSGVCGHRIFATSQTYDGDLGGLSGADRICQNLADSENLGGTWKAVLSDGSTDARSRLSIQASVVDLDGRQIAASTNDFWSDTHDRGIHVNESGSALPPCNGLCTNNVVWSGTRTDGTATGKICNGWTDDTNDYSGDIGSANASDESWIADNRFDLGCSSKARLYCVDGQ